MTWSWKLKVLFTCKLQCSKWQPMVLMSVLVNKYIETKNVGFYVPPPTSSPEQLRIRLNYIFLKFDAGISVQNFFNWSKKEAWKKTFLAANISMCSFYPCPRRSKNSHWNAMISSAKLLCNSCRAELTIIASLPIWEAVH